MSTFVKDMVLQAYKDCNLVGDGMTMTGAQLSTGIDIMNRLSDLYNQQEFLPFTQRRTRVSANGAHCIVLYDSSDTTWELPDDDEARQTSYAEIAISSIPVAISSMSYKIGIMWTEIKRTGFADLQNYIIENNTSLPNVFSYIRRTYVDDNDVEHCYGEIWLNIGSQFQLQIVYNKKLPIYDINSVFSAPGQEYEQLFTAGIAKELCRQNGISDSITNSMAVRESEAIGLIKNTNSSSHMITYGDGGSSTWYNILSPANWRSMS